MQMQVLDKIVKEFVTTAPQEILEQLEDVPVVVVLGVQDARSELQRPEYNPLFEDLGEQGRDLVDDCKGIFIGFPMQRAEDATGDAPGEDGPADYDAAAGLIVMVADNLADEDEARTTLMHEVAHALGIDENGVDGLGLNDPPQKETTNDDAPKPAADPA
jgi:predicted Zn-dependent protease with MMP-like domain